jgi:hypothetical protein
VQEIQFSGHFGKDVRMRKGNGVKQELHQEPLVFENWDLSLPGLPIGQNPKSDALSM